MSLSESKQSTAVGLGIAIMTRDSARHARLRDIVQEAGHRIVESGEADVLLLDGENVYVDRPAVVIGERDAGRAGWLPVEASAQQIDAALRAVAAGLHVRAASEANHRSFEELSEQTHAVLTPRELDVLAAIGAGHSNKVIARELGISLHTVKFHIESLLRKLGARTRAEAVAKGLERRVRQVVEL